MTEFRVLEMVCEVDLEMMEPLVLNFCLLFTVESKKKGKGLYRLQSTNVEFTKMQNSENEELSGFIKE